MDSLLDRITLEAGKCGNQLCIRKKRLRVCDILELLSAGATFEEILDVVDGAFVTIDATGIRTHIPVGSIATILLEPGTRISHAAVVLAAKVGTLLVWVGEAGVRLYASGQPGGARSDKLLYQAKLAFDDIARLKVVRTMYELRFDEAPPAKMFPA